MKILRLTLKKHWFDMIKSGVKKEEYREIKSYWIKRFLKNYHEIDYLFFEPVYVHYDAIEFVNGYSPKSPRFTIECLGIDVGQGNSDWGANIARQSFILKLGVILKADAQKDQSNG